MEPQTTSEIEFQRQLYKLLELWGYSVYADKQRPQIGWYPKTFKGDKMKPDLLLFHNLNYKNTHKDHTIQPLPSPIGIEIKLAYKFNNITKGMYYQMERKYKDTKYVVPEKNWSGKIPLLCLTTDKAINNGVVWGDSVAGPIATFVIERMLWRFDMGLFIRGNLQEYATENSQEYLRRKDEHTVFLSFDNQNIEICKI
jgi:hypothetical protein